jgi:hypothetical protein
MDPPIGRVAGTFQPFSRIKKNLAKFSASRTVGPDFGKTDFPATIRPCIFLHFRHPVDCLSSNKWFGRSRIIKSWAAI